MNIIKTDLVGPLQSLVDRDGFESELELAFGDASDVKQVVDESRFEFDIATDHFQRMPRRGRIRRARFQFADHGDDGREGIAQLMGQKCEELIFGRIGPDQFLA